MLYDKQSGYAFSNYSSVFTIKKRLFALIKRQWVMFKLFSVICIKFSMLASLEERFFQSIWYEEKYTSFRVNFIYKVDYLPEVFEMIFSKVFYIPLFPYFLSVLLFLFLFFFFLLSFFQPVTDVVAVKRRPLWRILRMSKVMC